MFAIIGIFIGQQKSTLNTNQICSCDPFNLSHFKSVLLSRNSVHFQLCHVLLEIVVYRQVTCSAGPGLAIRVICASEMYKDKDFFETAIILRLISTFAKAIQQVNPSFHPQQALTCHATTKYIFKGTGQYGVADTKAYALKDVTKQIYKLCASPAIWSEILELS